MNVPFVDLASAYRELSSQLDEAYRRVAGSGWYILGEEVEEFEREFAAFCGAKHCVGVGNGLDALRLTLHALGVGPGDEVVVPANTFVATWLAVSQCGAKPVPVDVDVRTGNLDPDLLPGAMTQHTRAIIAVHLYGIPADIDPITETARGRGVPVVEDAAQAHGARYKGRKAGTLADAAAFSFHPTKNLGALGDGGAVVTDDGDLADQVRTFRNYGSRAKYQHTMRGVNSRLDALQAAFLRVKLGRLEEWNERRRAVAARYLRELAAIPGLWVPRPPAWAEPAWHLFTVRHRARDRFLDALRNANIEALVHYPIPPHLSQAYHSEGWKVGDFPIAEQIARTTATIPIGPHLPEPSVSHVISVVREFCESEHGD